MGKSEGLRGCQCFSFVGAGSRLEEGGRERCVRVKGAGAVEKLEVEGYGCLAVDFTVWGRLHRHLCDCGVVPGWWRCSDLP